MTPNLGIMYEYGHGVEPNIQKALTLYIKSAEQGYMDAQYALGLMYDKGDGVEQNKLVANQYFKQSCERGFERACNKLKNNTMIQQKSTLNH